MNQRPRRNPVLLGAAAVLVTALCCAAPVLIDIPALRARRDAARARTV